MARGAIIDVETAEMLRFQYDPTPVKIRRVPDYATNTIVGQSHPREQFVSGGSKLITFGLDFHWESADFSTVQKRALWLESLTYPTSRWTGELEAAPHPVALSLGQTYLGRVFTTRKVEIVYPDFDPETLHPLVAHVELEFAELVDRSVSYEEIRSGTPRFGGFDVEF